MSQRIKKEEENKIHQIAKNIFNFFINKSISQS